MKPVGAFATTALAAVACFLVCGCQGTEWSNVKVASPYHAPRNGVHVSVGADAHGEDLEEAVSTFTTELVEALKDAGLNATVDQVSPDSDQLELTITEWEPGSQALRYFVGFGAGEERVVIIVDMSKPSGKTVLHGRIRSYVAGGFFGGATNTSLREAAKAIADAVSTGNAD